MNILFVKLNKNYLSQFSKFLIPMGIKFKHAETFNDAIEIIKTSRQFLIFTDIDYPYTQLNDITNDIFMSLIKKLFGSCSNVILLTSHQDISFLENFIYEGILGIVYKSSQIYEMAKQFCFILKSVPDIKYCREFVRVKPDPHENAQINVFSPSKGVNFKTNISDLSIKGVAFKQDNKLQIFAQNGESFENIELFLNNRIVPVSGKIIKKGEYAFIIFEKLKNYSEQLLCRYVAEKMVSENIV